MKKIVKIVLLLIITIAFTACNILNEEEKVNTNTEIHTSSTEEITETSEQEITEETTITTIEEYNRYTDTEEEKLALIERFPREKFQAPDGSYISKNEASDAYEHISFDGSSTVYLKFDNGYMRYAKPIFDNTLDNPSFADWENDYWNLDKITKINDLNYFKVKAGDTLENGLKVASAFYEGYASYANEEANRGDFYVTQSEIRLDGTVTMEGILQHVKNNDYIDYEGDLIFYPNSVKSDTVMLPVNYTNSYDFSDLAWCFSNPEEKVGILIDGQSYRLGNITETNCNLDGMFDEKSYVKVSATIDNIVLSYTESVGDLIYANLVSVERT